MEHLIEVGTSPSRLRQHLSALVLLFQKTLGKPEAVSFFSWPKDVERLPVVLSVEEVGRLLSAVESATYRMLFRTMFAAGLRISEACRLQVGDLDAERGVIRIQGKGDRARALLAQARESEGEEAAKPREVRVDEGPRCPDCGGPLERTRVHIPPYRGASLRGPPGGANA